MCLISDLETIRIGMDLHLVTQEPAMSITPPVNPASSDTVAGELALAIVLEDLRVRVTKAELTEDEARDIVGAALEHFPADANPELHALVDETTAPA